MSLLTCHCCLQKHSSPSHAVHVTVVDAVGIGAGGSGAAAGLLHPFTPKGKVRQFERHAMLNTQELSSSHHVLCQHWGKAQHAAAALPSDLRMFIGD
jgi:glycine/D-amino acid oxidase-like deaminating enzyme